MKREKPDIAGHAVRHQGVSQGVHYEIDYTWPREKLLSKAISIEHDMEEYLKEARLQDAETAGLIVLEIRQRLLGEDHEDTAAAYLRLGVVYDDAGEYARALGYYGKALRIYKKVLGEVHPSTEKTRNHYDEIRRKLE